MHICELKCVEVKLMHVREDKCVQMRVILHIGEVCFI